MAKSKTQYTRTYDNLCGVELGAIGSDVSRGRLAYAENMYRDWNGSDSSILESIPGYRRIAALGGRIHSIILQRVGEGEEYLLIHSGTELYRMDIAERDYFIPTKSIATLEDEKCAHFSRGSDVYIISGGTIIRINKHGVAATVGTNNVDPYYPILTLNGEPYEQKNLLTDIWRIKYILTRPDEYSYGTPDLVYKIIDRELHTCAVSKLRADYSGEVFVPSCTTIGNEVYRVTEISEKAFYFCTKITAIHISEGVESIGAKAFYYCSSASIITLPDTVYKIGETCFGYCKALTHLYLGSGIYEMGDSPFVDCKSVTLYYAGTEEQLQEIYGYNAIQGYNTVYSSPYGQYSLLFPLPDDCLQVLSVTENGANRAFKAIGKSRPTALSFTSLDSWDIPHEIEITAKGVGNGYTFGTDSAMISGISAISGCKVAEVFDNRVFLSGNPLLPNIVFYSALEHSGKENPLYFGALSYFSNGIGGYPTSALLSVGGSLAVFKSGDDGSGSIFYHAPEITEDDYIPRIYPTTYTHSGVCAIGGAISFVDDPVFLTSGGLYALDKQTINYDRSVVCRSHNVNHDLQKEDLHSACLTEWCGYLVVLCGDTAYLADSRSTFRHKSGAIEYDWFILKGIGSYTDSKMLWRFDSYELGDVYAHPNTDEMYTGEIYSSGYGGDEVTFGIVNGKKYSVYSTGELYGGTFSPATTALGVGDLLFFGTESGDLMLFNNDKRGVPPKDILSASDFDAEEYAEAMGTMIHPYFYSFDGHPVRYAIKTACDDCGIPHLTKSTVKHSLVLRCRCTSSATIRCEAGTESSDYSEITSFPGGRLSFAEMDLSALSLSPADYHTLPIGEKQKRWIEKQITIYSEGYASPIGISAIAYRYTVEGKIKRS